ncbi:kinase-like domain-containing protein [Rhizophagus irregularis DAOM 181602=DAOM 197198]|nr:kinase-like domain-containing protein [Rhizophagus irregularis DAOM 181602=DAOM 197198]
MDETPKDLWKSTDLSKYRFHVTFPTIDSTIESEKVNERVVYIGDLEKRKQAYGICGECREPGTGERWCQSYFLNEIKFQLQIYLVDIVQCFGITQDPNNKEPTTKELYQTLNEWNDEIKDSEDSEYSEYSKYSDDEEDGEDSEDGEDNEDEDINSSDLSSFQFSSDTSYTTQSTSANPISECLDVQLSESELNEICQDIEHSNIE